MLDFTSVLYLGFRHGSGSVRPWSQLTTGRPAVLKRPKSAVFVAKEVARLQGLEQAVVGSSTLHLFWDLFGQLSQQSLGKRPFAIFLDAKAYPIIKWGAERARMQGVPIHHFPHQNAEVLHRLIKQMINKYRPLIVSDGLCGSCGRVAPVADYLKIARLHQGLLVLDDTQALGLLGHSPNASAPYGRLGGGTLRHQALSGSELIVISSLAKSFGVPLAALSGSRKSVRTFQARSETRTHCSPPSFAALHAAERALALNRLEGDKRRQQLAHHVVLFRQQLAENGLSAGKGLFPVQTLRLPSGANTVQLYKKLSRKGVRSVLRRGCNGRSVISFAITAQHRPREIKLAVKKLANTINQTKFYHMPYQSLI